MVQQQMTAMSKAEFTFVCSKESGQVSCAPPSVAGSSVTQIVSSERRNETVSSGSGSSSKDDSQRATLSPSLAPEGWEAGTDDDMDLGARGESDDQEDIIFVKMTVVSLRDSSRQLRFNGSSEPGCLSFTHVDIPKRPRVQSPNPNRALLQRRLLPPSIGQGKERLRRSNPSPCPSHRRLCSIRICYPYQSRGSAHCLEVVRLYPSI